MTLGDRIVIMKDGFVNQIGTPMEVFDKESGHNLIWYDRTSADNNAPVCKSYAF